MALTYGFYNSMDHDRKYDALQMSQIFDGIIQNGIYETIGGAMMVKANSGMTVNIQTGRAWFDHTWTYNSTVYPITLAASDQIVSRIDAIVLEVNETKTVRANSFKIVKGTAARNPVRPTLINTDEVHQHVLAYITVGAGVTSIVQSQITNMVGTSTTPFVIGVVKTMTIDNFIYQWGAEWDAWIAAKNTWANNWQTQMTNWTNAKEAEVNTWEDELKAEADAYYGYWADVWQKWYVAQTNAVNSQIADMIQRYSDWYDEQSAIAESGIKGLVPKWDEQYKQWFIYFINNHSDNASDYLRDAQKRFEDWFADLQVTLDGDVAGKLADRITKLEECCKEVKSTFWSGDKEHEVLYDIYDNVYTYYVGVEDSDGDTVLDSDSEEILGGIYNSEAILDSDGKAIQGRLIYAVK